MQICALYNIVKSNLINEKIAEDCSDILISSSVFFIIILNFEILNKNIIPMYLMFQINEIINGPRVIKSIKK